jgi:hypothetical protein
MPLLNAADFAELADVWKIRTKTLFEKKVTDDFVSMMIDRAANVDFKEAFIQRIKYCAYQPNDLWVTLGICFEEDHIFHAEGFGQKRMTIKKILHGTDALQQIASFIGNDIKVRPLYKDNVIYIKIEYWPNQNVPAYINNPEDLEDDE